MNECIFVCIAVCVCTYCMYVCIDICMCVREGIDAVCVHFVFGHGVSNVFIDFDALYPCMYVCDILTRQTGRHTTHIVVSATATSP